MKCSCKNCATEVGDFYSSDDHGGVIVACPSCEKQLYIPNGLLMEVEENPEDFDLPLLLEVY
jgi:hypothetical protein